MTHLPQPQARAHWVMQVLDVQFEPASPLTGEVFDIFVDQICTHVLAQQGPPALGLPTWRERRDASRTLFSCVLCGHIPGSPDGANRAATQLRQCAQDLAHTELDCVLVVQTLHECATKLESYGAALVKTRQHTYPDELMRARRVTRLERDLIASLLEFIEVLAPHGRSELP